MKTFYVKNNKNVGIGTLRNCINNANKYKYSTIIIKVNKLNISTVLPTILKNITITNDENNPIIYFNKNKNLFNNKGTLTVTNIVFNNNSNGIVLNDQKNITFNSCYFYNNKFNGCYLNNSQNIIFNTCYFNNNKYNGCYLNKSKHITFNTCSFDNNKYCGNHLNKTQNVIFNTCFLYNNEYDGTKLTNTNNTTFNNCNIYNNFINGMYIEKSSNTTITNCIIGSYLTSYINYQGNYYSGIFSKNNTNITINNSNISGNNVTNNNDYKYELVFIYTTNIQITNSKIATDSGGAFSSTTIYSKGSVYNENKYNYNLNLLISNSIINSTISGITTNSYLEYLYYKNTVPNINNQDNYFLYPNVNYLLYDGTNFIN